MSYTVIYIPYMILRGSVRLKPADMYNDHLTHTKRQGKKPASSSSLENSEYGLYGQSLMFNVCMNTLYYSKTP